MTLWRLLLYVQGVEVGDPNKKTWTKPARRAKRESE